MHIVCVYVFSYIYLCIYGYPELFRVFTHMPSLSLSLYHGRHGLSSSLSMALADRFITSDSGPELVEHDDR